MFQTQSLRIVLRMLTSNRCLSQASHVSPYQYSIVCITAPEDKVAKDLANKMLTKKMVACANITSKVTSMYTWKENVCEETEVMMWLKTRTSRVNDIITFVRQHHPYEVCEIIAFPITEGSKKYLDWIGEVVSEKQP